jgi:predicted SnoaL-like aldol condensation-catalyzing enzyme
VLLHSRYEGLKNAPGPLIAFDLFRFKDSRIVEHWGGQQPQAAARNPSGHTQVDGPTEIDDREKTEVSRTLVQNYRAVITVQQHYDRIGEFLADDYIQHAAGVGDGIERLKARFAAVVKPGALPTLVPRFHSCRVSMWRRAISFFRQSRRTPIHRPRTSTCSESQAPR